ncbi:MAG: NAD(P)/FAD-dependent oxidoreductase [Mogibacterium sp.]|nr:NAD(P)/FAD-dependent oxidoreductase [Mogibacterium sp.]
MLADLSDSDIDAIGRAVHCLTFHPESLRGWNDAQVTMGGVALDEIKEATSESRLGNGL